MKLKNLLFATMVACAFTACSESDPVSEVTPPVEEAAEATIDLAVTPSTKAGTKAGNGDANATESEVKINTLTVFVYDGANGDKFVTSATFAATGNKAFTTTTDGATGVNTYAMTEIKAKVTTAKIMVMANVDAALFNDKSLADACKVSVSLDAAAAANAFVMSSGAYSGTLVPEKTNTFGFTAEGDANNTAYAGTISLFRVASRVDVGKILLNFDQSTDLKGAVVTIDSIFIANARATSVYANVAEGSTVEDEASAWLAGVADFSGILKVKDAEVAASGALLADYSETPFELSENGADKAVTINKSFYILENSLDAVANGAWGESDKAHTLLVIKGTVKRTNGVIDTQAAWNVRLNKDGIATAGAATGVIARNTIYKVETITLKGIGKPYEPGTNETLEAKVIIAPWTVVTQAPEIE